MVGAKGSAFISAAASLVPPPLDVGRGRALDGRCGLRGTSRLSDIGRAEADLGRKEVCPHEGTNSLLPDMQQQPRHQTRGF